MSNESTLAAAYASAFAEIESATKSAPGQVGQQKYKYADLTSVIEAIKPHLVKHGLFFTQCPRPAEGGVSIETILHHASGDKWSMGTLFVPANKQDAQGFGSALTYARRYALVTAFAVPVEDDDGSAAVAGGSPKANKAGISENELSALQELIDQTGTDTAALAKHYKVASLKEMTGEQYKHAMAVLERKVK